MTFPEWADALYGRVRPSLPELRQRAGDLHRETEEWMVVALLGMSKAASLRVLTTEDITTARGFIDAGEFWGFGEHWIGLLDDYERDGLLSS